jgi:hypothetical protein
VHLVGFIIRIYIDVFGQAREKLFIVIRDFVALDGMFRPTWPSSGIMHCTKETLGSKSSKCCKVHPMSDEN